MAIDRIRIIKWESPASGGTETDFEPTEIDPHEDYADVRGVALQSATSDDDHVVFSRDDDGNMTFQDEANVTPLTLSDLVAGTGGLTADAHKTLRQLIHFIADGPAEGFATGAYREVTGTIFPTAVIWWESSGKLKKIVERLLTWTGVNVTTDKWKVYDTDGSTVLWTITDTVSYSGIFETSRTRAIVSGDA